MIGITKKLKRVTAVSTDQLYPETNIASLVLSSSGGSLYAFGLHMLKIALPTSTTKYLFSGAAGNNITWKNTPAEFGAAAASHTSIHTFGDIIKSTGPTVTLADFLADNANGKVPLSGGIIPQIYLPDYTQGHMKYVGSVSLAAGTTPANAINVSAVFTTLLPSYATPTDLLGTFYLVSAAGYIKADGIAGGTGFIHAETEGPVYLNTGDQIIFVKYNATGPEYTFAFMHRDFVGATTTTKGIFQIGALQTNRGTLASSPSAANVIDESRLRSAMRDIVYGPNIRTDNVPFEANTAPGYCFFWPAAVTGEPTHTTGTTVQGSYFGGFSTSDIGCYSIFSTGRLYKLTAVTPGTNLSWLYVRTTDVPTPVAREVIRGNGGDTTKYFLTSDNLGVYYKYTYTSFVEGDILFE